MRGFVVCHSRELAYQTKHEFDCFSKYFAEVKNWRRVWRGRITKCSRRGTTGRVLGHLRDKDLTLVKLSQLDVRKDVQQIFFETPKKKQVMMFSATMTSETRVLCMRFMSDPLEIGVDEESKLNLHGLLQHCSKLTEKKKEPKAQCSHGCSGIQPGCDLREVCAESDRSRKVVGRVQFPSIAIHSGLNQEDRIVRCKRCVIVSTNFFRKESTQS